MFSIYIQFHSKLNMNFFEILNKVLIFFFEIWTHEVFVKT